MGRSRLSGSLTVVCTKIDPPDAALVRLPYLVSSSTVCYMYLGTWKEEGRGPRQIPVPCELALVARKMTCAYSEDHAKWWAVLLRECTQGK